MVRYSNKMNTVILLCILTIIPSVCIFYFQILVLLVCNCVSLVTCAASSSSAAKYNQHCTTQNVSSGCMLTRLTMVAAACQNNIVTSPAKPRQTLCFCTMPCTTGARSTRDLSSVSSLFTHGKFTFLHAHFI